GELARLGASLGQRRLDRGGELPFLARQLLPLLLQAEHGRAGGHQNLVQLRQGVAHLLDRLLEHDLRIFGEGDEVADPGLEDARETFEHGSLLDGGGSVKKSRGKRMAGARGCQGDPSPLAPLPSPPFLRERGTTAGPDAARSSLSGFRNVPPLPAGREGMGEGPGVRAQGMISLPFEEATCPGPRCSGKFRGPCASPRLSKSRTPPPPRGSSARSKRGSAGAGGASCRRRRWPRQASWWEHRASPAPPPPRPTSSSSAPGSPASPAPGGCSRTGSRRGSSRPPPGSAAACSPCAIISPTASSPSSAASSSTRTTGPSSASPASSGFRSSTWPGSTARRGTPTGSAAS